MRKLYIILFLLLSTVFVYSHPTVVFTLSDFAGESEFSVSETKKVYFVKGNLMYQPSTKTWRIASRQYDFVGGDNKTSTVPNGRQGTIWANGVQCSNTTGNHVRNHTGWLDVFAWGTSGWYGDDPGEDDTKTYTWRLDNNPNQKITCNPYDIGHKDSLCLILGGDEYQGFTDAYANADWGVRNNAALGGSADTIFRTPTKEEYDYLLTKRTNAKSLRARGHIKLFGVGSAPDTIINGLILLPDDWDPAVLPERTIVSDADDNEYYETNEFTAAEWQILEENGAIFLPATGSTSKYNRSGFYWTSTSWKDLSAYNVEFGGYGWNGHASDPQTKAADKSSGRAVRLVMEIITREIIEIPASPITCDDYNKVDVPGTDGTITPVQNPSDHCEWKLKATPAEDYEFAYWIDLHGNKTYTDSTELIIDTNVKSYAMQAVFVNSNTYIEDWENDSIVYRAKTTDVLNNNATGRGEISVNNTLISATVNNSDFGVWKQKLTSELESNDYAGENTHIIIYDNKNVPTSVLNTVLPVLIVENSLSSSVDFHNDKTTDVHILNNSTLTINTNTTISGTLYIHPGSKVVVNEGVTLTVGGVVMKGNGIIREWSQFVVNGSVVNNNSDTIYYDYTIDNKEYYPLSLPYTVLCKDVYNPITNKAPSYLSYYYDTEARAHGNYGWKEYNDTAVGARFEAGKGYTVFSVPIKWKSNRQRTAIMRFPMKAELYSSDVEKVVAIQTSDYSEIRNSDKNWNLIGNPYLSEFTPNYTDESCIYIDEDDVRYITYSEDGFRSYKQNRLKGFTLLPFNCYFIQTESGENITFEKSDRASYAPQRSKNISEEIELGIILSQNGESDRMGILFGGYSDEYEINSDLVKWFGEQQPLSVYSISNGNPMTFQSLAMENLSRPILIGYRKAELKEMTISYDYENYNANVIDAVWLFDSETGKYTNLLLGDYKFIPNNTQDDTRFYLSIEVSNVATKQTEVYTQTQYEYYDMLGRQVQPSSFGVYLEYTNGNCKKVIR